MRSKAPADAPWALGRLRRPGGGGRRVGGGLRAGGRLSGKNSAATRSRDRRNYEGYLGRSSGFDSCACWAKKTSRSRIHGGRKDRGGSSSSPSGWAGILSLDRAIEAAEGMKVRRSSGSGEARFRGWKSRSSGRSSRRGPVVATGGGAVLENLSLLRRRACSFASRQAETINKRAGGGKQRPLIASPQRRARPELWPFGRPPTPGHAAVATDDASGRRRGGKNVKYLSLSGPWERSPSISATVRTRSTWARTTSPRRATSCAGPDSGKAAIV